MAPLEVAARLLGVAPLEVAARLLGVASPLGVAVVPLAAAMVRLGVVVVVARLDAVVARSLGRQVAQWSGQPVARSLGWQVVRPLPRRPAMAPQSSVTLLSGWRSRPVELSSALMIL